MVTARLWNPSSTTTVRMFSMSQTITCLMMVSWVDDFFCDEFGGDELNGQARQRG